ncbi:FkbM family methyltransferase [Arenibaculum pallidiluteum]|uniref:FkbM family methyltransferase n=1 Tax=Arenibaculum pallidiluteum TaxID=2812559 RepID=UPI001A973293|nr:FkbM family methyltransferase [Arenibaculum pallidiluteum]
MLAGRVARSIRTLAYRSGLFHPACLPVDGGRWLVRTAQGFPLYCLAADQSVSPGLALSGIWEPRVTRAFERCIRSDSDVVVEVGANIGYFTVAMARRIPAGRYFAFEANPAAFGLLKSNIALNLLWNVTAEQSLVADRKRSIEFNCLGRHLGSGSIADFGKDYLDAHADTKTTIVMEAITLDERLAGTGRVDVLKIDAEGAEPLILAGARDLIRNNRNLRIVMELNGPMVANFEDPQKLVSSLVDQGFEVFEISHARQPRRIAWREIDARRQYELMCTR